MSLWNLGKISEILAGNLIGDPTVTPKGISFNSKQIQNQECFVALRANRDGHDFIPDALHRGASCLIVEHATNCEVPQIIVENTTESIQIWGQRRFETFRPSRVFGVTGSAGKTTTKEFLSTMTSAWKTPGNFNNTLGLPMSLALFPENVQSAVLEMGMSTPGEIKRLTEIAPLDFGILTGIGHAHIENFPDGIRGIARAKGELVEGIQSGGSWVFPEDDEHCQWVAVQTWAKHCQSLPVGPTSPRQILNHESKGLLGEFFVYKGPHHQFPVHIQLKGRHHVINAALAIAIALESGSSEQQVASGAHALIPEAGRGRVHHLAHGGHLLDESYNASPESIIATAHSLKGLPGGELIAVLGSMRELGQSATQQHEAVGLRLRELGFNRLLCYGDFATYLSKGFGNGSTSFPSFEELKDAPDGLSSIPVGCRILVKGSRYWKSELAVEWILNSNQNTMKSS